MPLGFDGLWYAVPVLTAVIVYGVYKLWYSEYLKGRSKKGYLIGDSDIENNGINYSIGEGAEYNGVMVAGFDGLRSRNQRAPSVLPIANVMFYNPNNLVGTVPQQGPPLAVHANGNNMNGGYFLPNAMGNVVMEETPKEYKSDQAFPAPVVGQVENITVKTIASFGGVPASPILSNSMEERLPAGHPLASNSEESKALLLPKVVRRGIAAAGPLRQVIEPYGDRRQLQQAAYRNRADINISVDSLSMVTLGRYEGESPASVVPQPTIVPPPPPPPPPAAVGGEYTPAEARLPVALFDIDPKDLLYGDLLGVGAFGRVYRGKWKGTTVAIKMLLVQNLNEAILNDFKSEVTVLSALRHPNVCLYLGASTQAPNFCIVTELVGRGSLWDVLHTPSVDITWDLVRKMATGSCCGLIYLHSMSPPILHRDLKSANLLIDESYTAKLSDFGLARVKAATQTMTGNCGTVQWMAPEILASQKYTEKADVYSFGIMLWEFLTRACPYDGITGVQVAIAVLNEGRRPDIPSSGVVPPQFVGLFQKCWDTIPDRRPTFIQVLEALEAM
jgi:hypothetical protein